LTTTVGRRWCVRMVAAAWLFPLIRMYDQMRHGYFQLRGSIAIYDVGSLPSIRSHIAASGPAGGRGYAGRSANPAGGGHFFCTRLSHLGRSLSEAA
jgi:hypothetical protein